MKLKIAVVCTVLSFIAISIITIYNVVLTCTAVAR